LKRKRTDVNDVRGSAVERRKAELVAVGRKRREQRRMHAVSRLRRIAVVQLPVLSFVADPTTVHTHEYVNYQLYGALLPRFE